MSDHRSLVEMYDAYPRIEAAFQAALDSSLSPRGPDMLYDLVRDLRLRPGAAVVDVGCGEGNQALQPAERFAFSVRGFDPVPRHVELANDALRLVTERLPELAGRVRFELGTAETLAIGDETVDFVWCKDVLVHVADLEAGYIAQFGRPAYDIMLEDCFWHLDHMTGKRSARVYLLSRPAIRPLRQLGVDGGRPST